MRTLPPTFLSVMAVVAPVFSKPVGPHGKGLIAGAILAPGRRTVTAALRGMGHSAEPHVQTYHRVLNRAVWSPLFASRLLLRLLVAVFVPWGVVVCGRDDTIERRRGDHMPAKGMDRDPVRSSRSHLVNVSGLGGLCGMLLPPMTWTRRVWALPCMTGRCPAARFSETRGRSHHTVGQRAWQSIRLVVRWWPRRAVVCVADHRDAVLE
jgi:hypothetical protein